MKAFNVYEYSTRRRRWILKGSFATRERAEKVSDIGGLVRVVEEEIPDPPKGRGRDE